MVRLRAKIEIEPTSLATRRMRKVPTIASTADQQRQQRRDEAAEEQQESRKSSGKASISARRRSSSTCLFTCSWATAAPPTMTPGLPLELLGDARRRVLPLLVVGGLQRRPRGRWSAAVAGDEVARAGVVVAA